MFKLVPNFSLRHNNSFGIDVTANYWVTISTLRDLDEAFTKYPHLSGETKMIIGGGSNLLFLSDFDGVVLSPDFIGYEITYQDDQVIEIEVGAGVEWDDFVAYCVEHGWYGVENLSLIPGKVGAAPVQNIGAYGVEIEQVIVCVKGLNLETGEIGSYTQEQCCFSYRSSIFKEKMLNRFMVISVVFRLQKMGELVSAYGDLSGMLKELDEPSLKNARDAVIKIRRSKLPDPKILGNAGSFFRNPILSAREAASLAEFLPGLPLYPTSGKEVKVAAGFLIDHAGWKGRKVGRAAVHDRQALVLVNLGGATGAEILELSMAIQQDVFEKFGVVLEREVQVVE
ncbi:MAG: UDP-N-acetylmuramate dehydrogenase [Prolixibacteraceae bacterium]|jgi:UDP-N-acetylmuramate dehydrogenase|nr:UDP-N-acetylmuramate dehydrogenase [Prolixibacteraceae bacterium]